MWVKIKVEQNQSTTKKRATRIPLQLQERVQQLLDILTQFGIIAPVNTDSLTTGNSFINPVTILKNKIIKNRFRCSLNKYND